MDAATKGEVATGLAKLADAVHHLRAAQADMEKTLARGSAGAMNQELALGLDCLLGRLSEAVAGVTPAMWAMMLSERHIGIEEIRKALEAAA